MERHIPGSWRRHVVLPQPCFSKDNYALLTCELCKHHGWVARQQPPCIYLKDLQWCPTPNSLLVVAGGPCHRLASLLPPLPLTAPNPCFPCLPPVLAHGAQARALLPRALHIDAHQAVPGELAFGLPNLMPQRAGYPDCYCRGRAGALGAGQLRAAAPHPLHVWQRHPCKVQLLGTELLHRQAGGAVTGISR